MSAFISAAVLQIYNRNTICQVWLFYWFIDSCVLFRAYNSLELNFALDLIMSRKPDVKDSDD